MMPATTCRHQLVRPSTGEPHKTPSRPAAALFSNSSPSEKEQQ